MSLFIALSYIPNRIKTVVFFMYNVSPFRGFFFNRDIPIYVTTSSDSFPIPDEIIIRFTGGESLIRLFQIKYNNTYNRLYRSNIN